jgi:hypothetical protein
MQTTVDLPKAADREYLQLKTTSKWRSIRYVLNAGDKQHSLLGYIKNDTIQYEYICNYSK